MPEVALAILWHQHQPYYPDDVAGENPMPWVRLHGVKDYYGMALHLLEFPEMRCTINLVPSLLLQLQAYTERGAHRSAARRLAHPGRRPERGRLPVSARQLLHGQPGPHDPAVPALPRAVSAARPGTEHRRARRCAASPRSDFRDLQVWFNLTWVHPLAFEHDAGLRELMRQGPPLHRRRKELAARQAPGDPARRSFRCTGNWPRRGQVELTTTPYYHPILPLLFDKKLAREAMPDVKLPRYTGGYPEDAAVHVRAGRRAARQAVRQAAARHVAGGGLRLPGR